MAQAETVGVLIAEDDIRQASEAGVSA